MSSKARITYRFDNQHGARLERKPEENKQSVPSNVVPFFQEEMKFTSDIGPWNSPFQDDAHALERLIREADGQFGADGHTIEAQTQPHSGDGGKLHTTPGKTQLRQERTTRPQHLASPAHIHPTKSTHAKHSGGLEHSAHQHPTYPNNPAPSNDMGSDGENGTAYPFEEVILLGDDQLEHVRATNTAAAVHYPIIEVEEDKEPGRRPGGGHNEKRSSAFMTAKAYRPSRGPSWYKVFASVAGAIATGAVFGYMVLALFAGGGLPGGEGGEAKPVAGETAKGAMSGKSGADAGSGASQGAAQTGGAQAAQGQAAGTALKVSLPAETYYMLQYGVFSSKDGLDAAVAELAGKGLAAAPLTTDRDWRVYVGIASDRKGAEALAGAITGMEVYVKQIEVPAVDKIVFEGDANTASAFFKTTNELIRALDGLTAAKLGGAGASDSPDWKALHQRWTEDASYMTSKLVREADKAALAKLMQAVNSAAVAAGEYEKKPSEAALWTVQTSLMKAVFAQKAWFETMDAL